MSGWLLGAIFVRARSVMIGALSRGCGARAKGILMTITLTPEQQARLNAYVERGDFSSIEEAARQLLDESIAERDAEEDDLAWAKLYVDEALGEAAKGNVITREEHEIRTAARLAAMKR
jgi:Arc/MetJ-type ribon-helix-helix transcriptional regulator